MKKYHTQLFFDFFFRSFGKATYNKALLLYFLLSMTSYNVLADGAIGYKGIYINNKGTKTWYKAHNVAWGYNGCGNYQFNSAADFSGQNFGSFTSTETLQISGFAVVGWTNSSDWVAGKLLYRVWKQGDTEPVIWSEIFIGNYGNGNGAAQVVCTSGIDRVVGYDNGTTDINPGAPGTYNFKIQALGRMQYSGGGGGFFNENDGTVVTTTFTINSSASDNFRSRVSGSWNSAESWESSSNGTNWATSTLVPGVDASSVTILSGHTITLNANITVKSLIINSGGTFTASDANPRTLSITKSTSGSSTTLANNGTWSNGTGGSTIVFTGSPSSGDAVHGVSGTIAFDNITINKTGGSSNVGASFGEGSSVSGTLEIGSGGYVSSAPPSNFYGSNAILKFNQGAAASYEVDEFDNSWSTSEIPNNITITSGTVILDEARSYNGLLTVETGATLTANNNLTIESDAINTGTMLNYGTVTGNVTMQRYVAGANWTDWRDGWHMISSPVAEQAISPNFVVDPAVDYDFYSWYEPEIQWVNYKNTSTAPTWATANTINNNIVGNSANFLVGKGYLISYKNTSTKLFTGVLNSEDVVITGLNITDNESTKSFHLLGNPFPSALLWDEEWTKGNIAATIQIWNEGLKDYSPLAYGNFIPAMNGFMVEVNNDNASITIPKAKRVHNAQAWYKNSTNQSIKLTALAQDNSSGKETFIRFNPISTQEFDIDFDGSYLQGYGPKFYSLTGENKFSVNTLPEMTNGLQIPLVFSRNESSEFRIEASEFENIQLPIYLTDLKTNTVHKLSENPIYSFTSNEGDDSNRFLLHFGLVNVGEQLPTETLQAYAYNDRLIVNSSLEKASLSVYDLQGRLLLQRHISESGLQSVEMEMPAGVYIVRLQNTQQSKSVKIVVQ